MNLQKHRAVVIGIDGATFRIIKPLIAEGKLPNLAKMIAKGVHGVLNSTIPPVSPVAWTSFMTGKIPEKHQIFDFSGKIEGTYEFRFNDARNRQAKPLWMNLSERGKRVLVMGVTMTYPPDPVNGYMVSGLGAPPDSDIESYTYPAELATEIWDNLGEYRIVPKVDLRKLSNSDSEKKKYLSGIFHQIDYRVKLFTYMWDKKQFDFSMLFFLDTDGISHYFWKYMDPKHKHYRLHPYSNAIFKVYEKVDSAIGDVLNIINNESDVVIVSDHGFGPLNRIVFLNNWLATQGYLTFKNIPWFKRASSQLRSLIRSHRRPRGKEIDWQQTKAYFSGTVGNIFINLKGKDPEGIVDSSEYDELCEKIIVELMNLEDSDSGEKVVERVYKKGDLFKTKNILAPDLVVSFKKGYATVGDEIGLHCLEDTGEIIADSSNWSGTHEPDGVFIAYGKGFKNGYSFSGANIIDIAPTLLYLLGVPVPENMDGIVLKDIFEHNFVNSNPISYFKDEDTRDWDTEGLTEAENEKLRGQLRDLGYID